MLIAAAVAVAQVLSTDTAHRARVQMPVQALALMLAAPSRCACFEDATWTDLRVPSEVCGRYCKTGVPWIFRKHWFHLEVNCANLALVVGDEGVREGAVHRVACPQLYAGFRLGYSCGTKQFIKITSPIHRDRKYEPYC